MKKNIIAAFTAGALLTLSLSAGPLHAAPSEFKDIQGVPGADKIESLHQDGLIKGVSDSLFKPEEQLSTAQGVQLIVDGLDLNLDAIRFIKMPVPSDYFSAVKTASGTAMLSSVHSTTASSCRKTSIHPNRLPVSSTPCSSCKPSRPKVVCL